jgi:hypothetical protein
MEALTPELMRSVAMINLGVAVLCMAGAYPLFREKVPPNGTFGLRSKKSMASEQAWYRANRTGGACILVGATAVAVLNGFQLGWGLPIPAEILDDVLLYSAPGGLLTAAITAWLLHLRD